jgi:hypothetical protein
MAELVDALVSGTSGRKIVEVRVLFWAPKSPNLLAWQETLYLRAVGRIPDAQTCCTKGPQMGRRRLPNPTQRKGSLTWEVRCRVDGRIFSRSLGTRDYDEALKRIPRVYGQLLREHDKTKVTQNATVTPPALIGSETSVPQAPRISIEQACQRYREHKLADERQFRTEYAAGGISNPVELAASYEVRLRGALERARAQAIVHDFSY